MWLQVKINVKDNLGDFGKLKTLLILAFMALPLCAQNSITGQSVFYQVSAPSGSCAATYLIYATGNNTVYACNASSWGAIAGGASSGVNTPTFTGIAKATTSSATLTVAIAGTDYQAPISLTTTGTSGAATFSGNVLNIPQYSSGSQVYPGAGIANSTGSAWGTSYTTSGSGTVLCLSTGCSMTNPALGTPSAVVLTNAIGLPAAQVRLARSIGAVIDGGGSAISAGKTVYFTYPGLACTISAWNITVDTGTATVDVWKIASGTAIPTVTNTITASAVPAIASGTALHSTTLTGWTTSVAQNDILALNAKTVSGPTIISLVLECDQ